MFRLKKGANQVVLSLKSLRGRWYHGIDAHWRANKHLVESLEQRVLLSGDTLTTLASFNGTTDGANPDGGVILSGSTLYGTTYSNGDAGDGVVFSLPITGGTPTVLASLDNNGYYAGSLPEAALILSGSTLYGTTDGGANDDGEVFSLPITGGTTTVLAQFNGADGDNPDAGLILSGNTLYGTTWGGGDYGGGEVFSLPTSGGTPTVLASLGSTYYAGSLPEAGLILSGSTLYGTTSEGGANNDGEVFSLPIAGGTPTVLASFNGTDGADPEASLMLSGSTLYGTTSEGGANSDGEVFSLPVAGGTPTVLASFNGIDGYKPEAGLVLSAGILYGTTEQGGVFENGVLFSVPITGGTPTVLVTFDGSNGVGPEFSLIQSGSTLYGTTGLGGADGEGTVFELGSSSNQLVFAQQPTDVAVGTSKLSSTVTVDIKDQNGNIITDDNSDVTVSIESGPENAILGGTLTVQAQNGVATFSDLTLTTPGPYILQAKDPDATAAKSNTFTVTTLLTMADLSQDVYGTNPSTVSDLGYTLLYADTDSHNAGYAANVYQSVDEKQIVIAVRGTQPTFSLALLKNLIADLSFGGTTPSPLLTSEVSDTVTLVQDYQSVDTNVTLTGHSLGGAVAQLVGEASGLPTYAFNAPGAAQLFGPLSEELEPVVGRGPGTTNVNYRIYGDQVSLIGTPFDQTITLPPPQDIVFPSPIGALESVGLYAIEWLSTFYDLHIISTVISQIGQTPISSAGQPNIVSVLESMLQPNSVSGQVSQFERVYVTSLIGLLFDPTEGSDFTFTGGSGSPDFASFALPTLPEVAEYQVRFETNGVWSGYETLQPGALETFGSGVDGIEFSATDSSGNGVAIPDFAFYASFDTSGYFSGTLNQTSAGGWVDTANMDQISGWAYDPTNPTASIDVEVAITGGPTQIFSADQSRADLQSVLGSTNHGFTYSTPVLSLGTHTVNIYALEGDGVDVLLATKTVTSQNSLFDEHYYLTEYPNVAAAVASGAIATGYDHYIEYGQYEGYSPSPYWDEAWYLQENPDVAAAVKADKVSSGFMQYYLYGQYENRGGLLYFNASYYLANYSNVAAAVKSGAVTSAFEHFVLYGQYEGYSPMLYFSSAVCDADNAYISPFVTGEPFSSNYEWYIEYGQYEGALVSNYYNEQIYLADNPDVAAAVRAGLFPDGFQHWLEYGQYEGRKAV